MPVSVADIPTPRASRYLQQLAKHWSHKYETSFTPQEARIALPFGSCVMHAGTDHLHVRLEGNPDADMQRFRTVFANHLTRFAFREELEFNWRDAEDANASEDVPEDAG